MAQTASPGTQYPDRTASNLQSLRALAAIVSISCILGSAGLFIIFVQIQAWQLSALAAVFAACGAFSTLAIFFFFRKKINLPAVLVMSLLFGLTMIGSSALLDDLGYPAAIIYLIFILFISSFIGNPSQANLIAGSGIVISGISALLNDFSPVAQFSNQLVITLTPAILGILFMVYVALLVMQSVTASLRIRLVSTFLAIVLIPLGFVSIFQSQFIFSVLNDEVNKVLRVTAEQTARELDEFFSSSRNSLEASAQSEAITAYLELSAGRRPGSLEEKSVRLALDVLQANLNSQPGALTSYALLDLDGANLYDTFIDAGKSSISAPTLLSLGIDPERLKKGERPNEAGQDYFTVPVQANASYLSPFFLPTSTRGFFVISAPVRSRAGQVIGVLRLRYDGTVLQGLLKGHANALGSDTYPILFDENNIRLADTFTPQYLYKAVAPLSDEKIQDLKQNRRLPDLPVQMLSTNYGDFNEVLNDYETRPNFLTELSSEYETNQLKEIGAIVPMKTMSWKVVYLQTNYNNQALRSEQGKLTTLVTTIVAVVVGLIALNFAHLLSSPIIKLSGTAHRIMQGDLNAQAPALSSDEYGMLGRTFNSMTAQLHGLINNLEDRVRARTLEVEKQNEKLRQRARELETVADVARQIVSAQDLEILLNSITRLVSERFDFYHVGVFLLDGSAENAVLRAANSPGGQKMLARRHMLPVGKTGIVGFVTGSGQPWIATDVGKDAVFFNNPDLPDTRSEMALPLKVGETIIGALDIQSTQPDAFDEDAVELFSTLADQVAIAIYNNQLYLETRRALDEAQALHRQYLRSEWAKETSQRKTLGYIYSQKGISPLQDENPNWEKIFTTGQPQYNVRPNPSGEPGQVSIAVPISIRGETVGIIQVQGQNESQFNTQGELDVINNIAGQVAAALENARLFETTVRRAERENKVHQITAQIRASNNPDEMMQVAVKELQRALSATRAQIYIRQPVEDRKETHPGSNGKPHDGQQGDAG